MEEKQCQRGEVYTAYLYTVYIGVSGMLDVGDLVPGSHCTPGQLRCVGGRLGDSTTHITNITNITIITHRQTNTTDNVKCQVNK